MAYVKGFGIKWLFSVIILLSFLTIFESITLGQIIMISLVLTGITYLVGDLFILPVFGMLITAILDFGLSFLIVWLTTGLFIGQSTALVIASVSVAYFFALCEGLFHGYMKERVLPKKQATIIPFPAMKFQTEVSEEIYPDKDKKEKEPEFLVLWLFFIVKTRLDTVNRIPFCRKLFLVLCHDV